MKSTCDGCKAFMNIGVNSTCALGFRIKLKSLLEKPMEFAPDEPCPKPRTKKEYIELLLSPERHAS